MDFFKYKLAPKQKHGPFSVIGFTISTRKVTLWCGRWIFGIERKI